MFRIVLIEPEIPQNTGNIGRLCASTGISLVLVGKLGFSLDDKYLKRSAMDYWKYVNTIRYLTIDEYIDNMLPFAAISTKGSKIYSNIYKDYIKYGDFDIVFGCESAGLPKIFYTNFVDNLYRIPMKKDMRSLNLSSATAIVTYNLLENYNFLELI